MEFTLGFIFIFISIIIPGLLFRRFYYYGEFSKQFSTKENIYQSAFYSIIPGLFIQLLGASLYFKFRKPNLSFFDIYNIHYNILNGSSLKGKSLSFINDQLLTYLIHTANIFLLSIFLGILFSRLIRLLKIDIHTKLFRFKNQWYYIFSGEILAMKKFKLGPTLIKTINGSKDIKASTTYADILIENNNGNRELYTGYVVDYELNSNDISQLERIYLLDACRYVIKKKKRKKRKAIPGEIFILPGKNIVNINLTYLPPSPVEKKTDSKDLRKQRIYLNILGVVTLLEVLFLPIILFINKNHIIKTLDIFYKENSSENTFNFFLRILIYFIITQFISSFLPSKRNGKLTYIIISALKKMSITFFLLLILYFFYLK